MAFIARFLASSFRYTPMVKSCSMPGVTLAINYIR